MENNYIIRKLTKEDIGQIIEARKKQEIENGNGATVQYIKFYKTIFLELMENNRIIAVRSF